MDKILTVAVPTYNAEKYLRDNLDSFCIEEILSDIEILIINDGSTDSSSEIALGYAHRYPETFRVITKENGGHGSAVNAGIGEAAGRYFKVVDADDWVDRKAFIELVNALKGSDSDIVWSGFLWAYDEGQQDKSSFKIKAEIPVPFEGVEYGREYHFDDIADKLYIKMHNITIKTELLRSHSIRLDEHCYYVDTEYITYPIPFVGTITFIDAFVYMYRIGCEGQSVDISKMQKNKAMYDKVLSSLLDFFDRLGGEIPCTEEKKDYIARIIARVVASEYKIILSLPAGRENKSELVDLDNRLKTDYPQIYNGNINRAVSILRKSRYKAYYPIAKAVKARYD